MKIFFYTKIMPKTYKPKDGVKKRKPIDKNKLKAAVTHVLQGNTFKGTAKAFDVPLMSLKRYVRKQQAQPEVEISYEPDYRQSKVFNDEEEAELAKYCEKASKLHHGLNSMSVRKLAYEFAVQNNKPADKIKKWINNMATPDWFYGFMRRNSQLSLRVPEATSLSRSTSFNRHNISTFFENLRSLLDRFHFGPEAIWNIDETGLSTVHKPKKVVATRGVKQIGKMTSGERGELVTACCAVNAMGNYIPPYLIFPRKNWQDRMLRNAPTGTDGNTFPSGWMTAENFVNFLKHFKKYSKCSLDSQMLIIMDNHDSHISLESLNFAKKNGIHLLTIPPHTSHKTQPLDRTVFGPLKGYFSNACDNWMLQNPGKSITIYEISELLGHAFPRAFTPQNIQSGFRVSGIFPFNNDIFTEDEFLQSYVTDRTFGDESEPNLESAVDLNNERHNSDETNCPSPQPSTSTAPVNIEITSVPSPSQLNDYVAIPRTPEPDKDATTNLSTSTKHTNTKKFITPEQIKPFPKAGCRKPTQKGRKKGSTKILTDTPEKNKLEEELLIRKQKKTQKTCKMINKEKNKAKRNLKAFEQSSSSEEEYEIPSSPESTYDVAEDEEQYNSSSCESENDNENNTPPETNDWVVVNLTSMKNLVHRYVGQIKSVTGDGYVVKFTKKMDDYKFKWPIKDDIAEIARYQVVKKLSPPDLKANSKRVISLTFKKSLRKLNIKG